MGYFHQKKKLFEKNRLPQIEVSKLLKEDASERPQGKPFRFGKDFDVNIEVMLNWCK